MTLTNFFLINLGSLIAAIGTIFLKKLSESLSLSLPIPEIIAQVILNKYAWLVGICYLVPIILWTYLLRSMDLTKLQPLLAIVYIYTILLSILILGEKPSAGRLTVIGIIMTGVIIVGRS